MVEKVLSISIIAGRILVQLDHGREYLRVTLASKLI